MVLNNGCAARFRVVYPVQSLIPLTALRPGQVAEIGQLLGPRDEIRRLEEMGLRSGVRLEMVRAGSPCIVRLSGSTLCFRSGEPLAVLVAPGMSA